MSGILVLIIIVLSFIIAFALGLGGLGASIIYMLLLTVVAFIATGKQEKDAQKPQHSEWKRTD